MQLLLQLSSSVAMFALATVVVDLIATKYAATHAPPSAVHAVPDLPWPPLLCISLAFGLAAC